MESVDLRAHVGCRSLLSGRPPGTGRCRSLRSSPSVGHGGGYRVAAPSESQAPLKRARSISLVARRRMHGNRPLTVTGSTGGKIPEYHALPAPSVHHVEAAPLPARCRHTSLPGADDGRSDLRRLRVSVILSGVFLVPPCAIVQFSREPENTEQRASGNKCQVLLAVSAGHRRGRPLLPSIDHSIAASSPAATRLRDDSEIHPGDRNRGSIYGRPLIQTPEDPASEADADPHRLPAYRPFPVPPLAVERQPAPYFVCHRQFRLASFPHDTRPAPPIQ